MKLGLFSDVHGNLPALEATIEQLSAQGITQYLCLGDVAIFGPQPSECVSLLRTLNCRFVMGNTDAYGLDPYPLEQQNEDSKYFNLVEAWSAAQLTVGDKAFITDFAPTITIGLTDSDSLLAYHGSPQSFNDEIRPESAIENLDRHFANRSHTFLAGGHIHQQFMRPYRGNILFNPGSVGLPIKQHHQGADFANPAYAEYAIVSMTDEQPAISFHRAGYSLESLVEAAKASGMPEVDWWLKDWVE